MKIFLSYGHNSNATFIENTKDDLSKNAKGNIKHEVWMDKSEIKAVKDWREKISHGLGYGPTEFFIMRLKDERLAIKHLTCGSSHELRPRNCHALFWRFAGQQRVPSSFLEYFGLPQPRGEKQLKITTHVYALRLKAKSLQQEGRHILDTAKQDVGRMELNSK